MSDGRGGPDVPRPENDATPHTGGGFTDPTPGDQGIIVQGGRTASDPRAIGPKQDDPRAIGPKQDDPRAIGPKQDDPRAIGPKQDDPRSVRRGIIVQGGRTGHPDSKARRKRAKKKTKTMMLVIGGVMVLALGGFFVGRQLGHDPATLQPQAAATPTAAGPADASGGAPSASTGAAAPAPATSPSAPAAQDPAPPTQAASGPPARGGGSPSPGRSTPPAPPKQSSAPPPAAEPVLALRPTGVREFCANGEWPATLLVRNSGGGKLTWSLGQLPSGVTASPSGGSLAADASQVVTLGGRTEQQPPNGRFTIGFTGNGGTGQVTVTCA
ncbi:hypothetical protein ABZ766_22150 [Streptomyces sp. NPDC006670]|uniref:hypothetical protein n=1 Tax=Streptomyces sp. NPDC006670 TaxID=3154476 RepID=UPI0033F13CBB